MSPIPWAAILRHGPTIVSAARALLVTQSSATSGHSQSDDTRLDRLEQGSVESARLIQEMAERLHALTLAQQELQRRVQIALIVGGVASAIAIIALIAVFIS